jgi:hypothetical protein
MESKGEYLARRAREELEAADRTSDPKVREIHVELAARYRNAADGDAPPRSADAETRAALLPSDFRIFE